MLIGVMQIIKKKSDGSIVRRPEETLQEKEAVGMGGVWGYCLAESLTAVRWPSRNTSLAFRQT